MFSLRARYVFPVSAPPICGGTVTVAGERIAAVGARPPGGPVRDFGDAAILPGLVNAHTHLEFSRSAAPLGQVGMALTDWLCRVIQWRQAGWADEDAVREGISQSAACGTTLLGETAQSDASDGPFQHSPIRATLLLELIAPTRQRAERALRIAEDYLSSGSLGRSDSAPSPGTAHHSLRKKSARCRRGLCPHAPYSVRWELLPKLAALSAAAEAPLAIHLAESREEIEFLATGRGPLREFLEQRGVWEPGIICPGSRPLDYLRVLGAAHRVMIVHGNYLGVEEIAFAAAHRAKMAVVYCPRSHSFFQHAPYRLSAMLQAGVCVALGSDSRASSPDLSMLSEMRHAAAVHPAVPPETLLRLATLGGAEALGWADLCGSLELGKMADLAVVALPQRQAADPHQLLFDSDLPVVAAYCGGRPVR